ncbi:MAG: hypothetical protein Kow0088_07460 [Anaerolineales bacterium]
MRDGHLKPLVYPHRGGVRGQQDERNKRKAEQYRIQIFFVKQFADHPNNPGYFRSDD